jgi:hypothetical protein
LLFCPKGNFSSTFCLFSIFNFALCGLSSNFFVHFWKLFLDFSQKPSTYVLYIGCLSSVIYFVRSMSLAICLRIYDGAIPARGYNLSANICFK